jgi:hypothetical protein
LLCHHENTGTGRGNGMLYYIYFDSYRRPMKAISEEELAEKYNGSPDDFLRAMSRLESESGLENAKGHVGTLRFDSEKELKEFFEKTGEEITGFYDCEDGSRPYNF